MYIVQDKESALFLKPDNGDVGFTPWLHEAGRFNEIEEAIDTSEQHCFDGFYITTVLK